VEEIEGEEGGPVGLLSGEGAPCGGEDGGGP
jgi:hypothetical protein